MRLTTLAAVFFLSAPVMAHNVQIENQRIVSWPESAPDELDARSEAPLDLDNVRERYDEDLCQTVTLKDSIQDSKATFAYLSRHDVDWFQFTIPQWEVDAALAAYNAGFNPFPGVLVNAIVLPPACKHTRRNYPKVALLGTDLPAPTQALPFDVPDGYGVVVAENPRVPPGEQREIFEIGEDGGFVLNLSWFLPVGLSQECFSAGTCDWTNTIFHISATAGTYYLVVWDPHGHRQDYTLSTGFSESNYDPVPELIDVVSNHKLVHRQCRPPYGSCQ